MSKWVEGCLGSLAEIEIGGTPSRDNPVFWVKENDKGFPWASIADLGPRVVCETKEQITELGVRCSNVKAVRAGTMIMSFKLTIGRAGIAGCELFTNEAIAAISSHGSKIDEAFLYYLLPPIALNAVTDTAIKGKTLNKTKLAALRLRFPEDAVEQRRIAEILSTVDEAIEQTEALIAKYQKIKAGLMNDLFTRGVTPDGRLRPTRDQAPNLYKQSPLGWIPKEWGFDLLGNVCERNGGSIQTGPFGSQLHAEDYQDTGVPIITVEHLGDNEILHENLPLVGAKDYARLSRYSLRKGDLVFSRVGAIDRCAYVGERENGWLFSGRCLRVRTGNADSFSKFISYQLNNYPSRKWVLNHSVGSTMACLNTVILSDVPILIPEPEEQKKIVIRLDQTHSTLAIEREHKNEIAMLKQGLMHDLLTGRVPVKVPDPVAA